MTGLASGSHSSPPGHGRYPSWSLSPKCRRRSGSPSPPVIVGSSSSSAPIPGSQLLQTLPKVLAIIIAGNLAVTSDQAMEDRHSLQRTCKFMHDDVCSAIAVGRRVALARFQSDMAWYRTLLTLLTDIGNPDSCFYSRLLEYFGEHRGPQPSLNELSRIAEGGHKVAAYLYAIKLYRNNGSAGDDDIAMCYIRWVEGEQESASTGGVKLRFLRNQGCVLCHEQAAHEIWRMTWRQWGKPLPPALVRTDCL